MPDYCRNLLLPILVLGLIGCGGQGAETAPSPEAQASAGRPGAPARSEPADVPPPALETEAAASAESEALAQARAERQRLRERRQTENGWWNDEAFSERLGLQPGQRAALLEARAALDDARLEARSRLLEGRAPRYGSGDTESAERPAELQQSREQIRAQLDAAEQIWQSALREILNPDQLERLREENASAPMHPRRD